ncbi:MAG: sigma-70 family RNA polymerase sigma factor, partial [Lachnospiraceae bacterium]|nr:sigma-70 family RNA polymerase sigma factor [Lachnospiraceae bacterium]
MAADNDLIVAVGRMKKGEEEGFNLVYQKTYNYVYFRSRQIMKDDEDALDLVQIVYIEAYKSIDTLDKPENIFAWLGAITYRQGMKIFRKKNEILLDEELKEEVFGNIVSEDTSTQPDLSAEQKDQQKAIGELIDQ